jgi:hypothetical protein
MRQIVVVLARLLSVLFGLATAFFTFFGVRLVWAALTFEGEGSLGHVGMFIAAFLFPLLAFLVAGLTFLAWKRGFRTPPQTPPTA